MYVLNEQSTPGMERAEALKWIVETYLQSFTELETGTAENFRLRNEAAAFLRLTWNSVSRMSC